MVNDGKPQPELSAGHKNRHTGILGEDAVFNLLLEKGITILERNFRCRYGEIDIIAKDGDTIVFIEVKARKSNKYGIPEEAVHYRKQQRLRLLAQYYLLKNFKHGQNCRFDVYSIFFNKDNGVETLRILENCL